MSATTTPEEREYFRELLINGRVIVTKGRRVGMLRGPSIAITRIALGLLEDLGERTAERDALAAEVERVQRDMEADLKAIEKVIREGAALSRPIDLRSIPLFVAAQEIRAEVERLRTKAAERDGLNDDANVICEKLAGWARMELRKLRPKGEIVRERFAISHAPRCVKGGPWEAVNEAIATPTPRADDAWTIDDLALARQLARAVRGQISTAHVVRFVTRKKAKK